MPTVSSPWQQLPSVIYWVWNSRSCLAVGTELFLAGTNLLSRETRLHRTCQESSENRTVHTLNDHHKSPLGALFFRCGLQTEGKVYHTKQGFPQPPGWSVENRIQSHLLFPWPSSVLKHTFFSIINGSKWRCTMIHGKPFWKKIHQKPQSLWISESTSESCEASYYLWTTFGKWDEKKILTSCLCLE